MKKVYFLLAAAAIVVAGCSEKYVIPVDPDDPDEPVEAGLEKTFVVNVEMQETVETTGWAAHLASMPGEGILDFFDLTEVEFYKGMGSYSGTASAGTTTQEGNTIMFGVADVNNHTEFKWIPSTTNNFGHWFSATGRLTYWNDEANDKALYVESNCDWGQDAPDSETLAEMWDFSIGFLDGLSPAPKAGDTYKVTEVFYMVNDDDDEMFAFVEWNIKITAAEEVKVNIVKTQEISMDVDYYDDYTGTAIDLDTDALQAALGVSETDCTVYAVNADGSLYAAPGTDFWFTVDGDRSAYGEGCGIDINRNLGYWSICNYPSSDLGGKTCKGAVVFVNGSGQGYLVKVTAHIAGYDPLLIRTLVSYEEGETEYTLSDDQVAAVAEALGLETVTADQIGADIAIVGINADGSEYTGEYTANNGYWYDMDGNVSNWTAIEEAGYVGSYVEYRGDFTFGLGLWEDSGVSNTVKVALQKDGKSAVLTCVLTVADPAVFETEEVAVMNVSVSQTVAAGYGGGIITLDKAEVLTALGLTEEEIDDCYMLLDQYGKCEYTANGGFWFDAEGNVTGWGDASFYVEPADEVFVYNTGIHPDNVKSAATFQAVLHIANIRDLKHITLNVTVTATE